MRPWRHSRIASRDAPVISIPDAPSVVAGHGRAAIFTIDGELLLLPAKEAAARLRAMPPPLLVHAPATFRRLGLHGMPAFDLLELKGRRAAVTSLVYRHGVCHESYLWHFRRARRVGAKSTRFRSSRLSLLNWRL